MTAPPGPAGQAGGWLLGQRYRVLDRIGSGGMAEVFRARDELLARDVAVKVFRAEIDPADSAGGVQRQQLELQALAQLSHPNLITLFDGQISADADRSSGEHAYLVMELISGPSLAARLADGPLPEPEARMIGAQISDALSYVHTKGMVHRDVKPANILLGVDEVDPDRVRARLSDFGIVRLLGSDHLTNVNFMVGTASYLSPEQARGLEVGPPADVYALGLVLLESLTGQRSYPGSGVDAVIARLDAPPAIPAGLPQPWPGLLQAMTATDPASRPSAPEVARQLRGAAATDLAAGGAAVAVPAAAEATTAFTPLDAAAGTSALPLVAAAPVGPPVAFASAGQPRRPEPRRAGWLPWLIGLLALLAAVAVLLVVLGSRHTGTPTPSAPPAAPGSTARTSTTTSATTSSPSSSTTSTEPTTSAATSTAASSTTARTTSAPPTSTAATTSVPPTSTTASSAGASSSGSSAVAGSGSATATGTASSASQGPVG